MASEPAWGSVRQKAPIHSPGQGHEVAPLLRLAPEAEEHVLGKAAGHGDDDGHAGVGGGELLQGQGPGHGVQAHPSPLLRGGHAEEAELGQGLELGPGVLGLPVVLGGEGVEDLPGHPAHRVQNQPLLLGEGHPPYRNIAGRQKSVTFPPTGGALPGKPQVVQDALGDEAEEVPDLLGAVVETGACREDGGPGLRRLDHGP